MYLGQPCGNLVWIRTPILSIRRPFPRERATDVNKGYSRTRTIESEAGKDSHRLNSWNKTKALAPSALLPLSLHINASLV